MQVIPRRTLRTFPTNGGRSSCGLGQMRPLYALLRHKKTASCFYSQSVLLYAASSKRHVRTALSRRLDHTSLRGLTGARIYVSTGHTCNQKEERNCINQGVLPHDAVSHPQCSLHNAKVSLASYINNHSQLVLFLLFAFQQVLIASITISFITLRTTIAAIPTLLPTSLALAVPQPSSTSAVGATITPPRSYYFKPRVVGHGYDDKVGRYVSNYHTGMNPGPGRPVSAGEVGTTASYIAQVLARPI